MAAKRPANTRPAEQRKIAAHRARKGTPPGVPTCAKLTPDIQARICDAIRKGATIETAAVYAGIVKDTLYQWLKKGRAAKSGGYFDFVVALEHALADCEVQDLDTILVASKEYWQAAAWRLERRYPDRYGRRQRVEHATPDGKAFPVSHTIDPSKLSDDELEALKRLLEAAQPDT